MVTWCSRAVNRSFPSFRAASRTRSSPLCPLFWLGVQRGLGCPTFSLVRVLPSTASSSAFTLSFGCFVGVGSEEARLRANHRPPLKLHVRFSRMQLSRRHLLRRRKLWVKKPSGPTVRPSG